LPTSGRHFKRITDKRQTFEEAFLDKRVKGAVDGSGIFEETPQVMSQVKRDGCPKEGAAQTVDWTGKPGGCRGAGAA
jgi:hypothetical protein